jgi:thioredoxin 1
MSDIVITDQNFQTDVLASDKPVLVDFWAEWCGPCKIQEPIIHELANEFSGKAVIGKLNVDENMQTAQQFNVMSIPTILIFKGGQVVKQFVGVQSKETIAKELQQLAN